MENDKIELSKIVRAVSRHTGAFVGTTAAIGKKIAGFGVSGVAVVGDLLTRPVEGPAPVTDEEIGPASEASALKASAENATARENTLSAPVAALQSDLASARRELEEAREAVFPNAAERIIFTRALSDIANQDAAARADAARAIGGIRHELSVRALAAQMARDPSTQVRQECVKALTTLGMKEVLPVVKRALTDRAASVRLAAVWGLYRLAGVESAPALAHMFSDEDEEVRRRAATCMGWLGHFIGWLGQEELAVELLPLLSDSSVSVRRAAVEAMGNLRSWQVVADLIERLNDPEKAIRKAVLGALETITGKKMSGPFPRDKKSLQRLIARWREWWKEKHPG